MPPKAKFTREEIIDAALKLVSEDGMSSLTARELGRRLGSSARPIFTVFQSMEEVHEEVYRVAAERFEKYGNVNTDSHWAFKELGKKSILFALEEPNLFQLLFMRKSETERDFWQMLKEIMPMMDYFLDWICKKHGLEEREAKLLMENVWIHTYGIGVLQVSGMCKFSENEINEIMMHTFYGILMLIKSGKMHEVAKILQKESEE